MSAWSEKKSSLEKVSETFLPALASLELATESLVLALESTPDLIDSMYSA